MVRLNHISTLDPVVRDPCGQSQFQKKRVWGPRGKERKKVLEMRESSESVAKQGESDHFQENLERKTPFSKWYPFFRAPDCWVCLSCLREDDLNSEEGEIITKPAPVCNGPSSCMSNSRRGEAMKAQSLNLFYLSHPRIDAFNADVCVCGGLPSVLPANHKRQTELRWAREVATMTNQTVLTLSSCWKG